MAVKLMVAGAIICVISFFLSIAVESDPHKEEPVLTGFIVGVIIILIGAIKY